MKDFFISYNSHNKQWAEWIAWTLEEAGYTVVIQAWDFRPGGNFVLDMQRAAAECEKTIAVLSEHYLKSEYTQSEWSTAFAGDPQSLKRKLIPMRVGECRPEGVLKTIVYVDLVGVTEAQAHDLVLNALKERAKPAQKPGFPGVVARIEPEHVPFPGIEPAETNNGDELQAWIEVLEAEGIEEGARLAEQIKDTESNMVKDVDWLDGIEGSEPVIHELTTTLSVFELLIRLRGLCSTFLLSPFALHFLRFALIALATFGGTIFLVSLPYLIR